MWFGLQANDAEMLVDMLYCKLAALLQPVA